MANDFSRPAASAQPAKIEEKAPDRGTVIADCRRLLDLHGLNPDWATDFVNRVCAAEGRYEGPHRVPVIGGGFRWVYPYHERVTISLQTYLGMPPKHQDIIWAGATDDHVRWRGEPVDVFLRIVEHSSLHREHGLKGLLSSLSAKDKATVGAVVGRK